MKSQPKLTTEEAEFIKANEQHFELVIKHAQHFQRSHDIASKVMAIHERLIGPVDYCDECEDKAHETVWKLIGKVQPTEPAQDNESTSHTS